MVQIIPANNRTTFKEKLSAGIDRGIGIASEYLQKNQNRDQLEKENEFLKKQGIDLSGISDPKMRQQYVAAQLSGANSRELEMMKQFSKDERLNRSQQFISGLGKKEMQDQENEFPKESLSNQFPSDQEIAILSTIDPNAARIIQSQKESASREERAQKELDFRKLKESPEHRREQQVESSQAQADVKYNQQLEEASKQHALKEQTLNRLEHLNKKGVTGKPYEKLLEKSGFINLTSEGRREFAADVKNLITDIRSILGAQFTGFEFQTILNAYPSADFSKEANAVIIQNLKEFQDIKSKEVEYARQIKKDNKGKIPFDFQSQVNEKVHEYASSKIPTIKENIRKIMNTEYGIPSGHTLMFDNKGETLSVPDDQIEKYMSLGASLP